MLLVTVPDALPAWPARVEPHRQLRIVVGAEASSMAVVARFRAEDLDRDAIAAGRPHPADRRVPAGSNRDGARPIPSHVSRHHVCGCGFRG